MIGPRSMSRHARRQRRHEIQAMSDRANKMHEQLLENDELVHEAGEQDEALVADMRKQIEEYVDLQAKVFDLDDQRTLVWHSPLEALEEATPKPSRFRPPTSSASVRIDVRHLDEPDTQEPPPSSRAPSPSRAPISTPVFESRPMPVARPPASYPIVPPAAPLVRSQAR